MSEPAPSYVSHETLSAWRNARHERGPLAFNLEITARCPNECRHCYINLPAGDSHARGRELSFEEIRRIADQAVSLGALWCLITGGEPLLRKDFVDIYLYLRRRGLLVSVFTAATLITEKHARLFKKHPPRNLEVTVYGVTEETYERVTRKRGSFARFRRGLNLLLENRIKVRLKAMALKSNVHELPEIARFCRERTTGTFRFDPHLHLRYDRDPLRNEEIRSERLSAAEVIALEESDAERWLALREECHRARADTAPPTSCGHLFQCRAGIDSFDVSYDGIFRLCSSLWHPDCIFDLRKGSLVDAWTDLVPRVRAMRSASRDYTGKCQGCALTSLCPCCPATSYLETGELDRRIGTFCETTHARAAAAGRALPVPGSLQSSG